MKSTRRKSLCCSLALAGVFFITAGLHAQVVINEILYHPDPDNTGGEYVEFLNTGDSAADLGGWTLSDAVDFQFPDGTTLEPGAYLVVARDPEAARAFYGIKNIIGPFERRLSNSVDTIVLQDAGEQAIDLVPYSESNGWATEADGGGPSLELIDPASDNALPESWGIGEPFTPGAQNMPGDTGGGPIVISEIMYKPERTEPREKFDRVNQGPYVEDGADEFGEFVEICNRSDEAVDLSGWAFTEGITFEFPEGTTLGAGEYLAVAARPDMLKTRLGPSVNLIGPFGPSNAGDATGLRDGGERITLRDQDGHLADTVRYNDKYPWPIGPDEFGYSLELVSVDVDNSTAANWRAGTQEFPTPQLVLADVEPGKGDAWVPLSVTGSTASATLVFAIYIRGAGEWLIDEVKLTGNDGTDLLALAEGPSGAFEGGDEGWDKRGNHETSVWTEEDAQAGTGSERLIALGNGSISNSVRVRLSGIPAGTQFTLSFFAKHLVGDPRLEARMVGARLDAPARITRPDFNLAEDWSDALNPNGFWEYRDGAGALIELRAENWLASDLGDGQTAWAAGDAEVPGWAKSVGKAGDLDFPEGTVGGYGPAEIAWVSPSLGEVTISGNAFLLRHGGRDQTWELKVNDRSLSTGTLVSGADQNSGNPMSLEAGTGGAEALTVTVDDDDEIKLVFAPAAEGEPEFVGVNVQLLFRSGSEPAPPVSGVVGTASAGQVNSVAADLPGPYLETLQHFPDQPTSTDEVTVSVQVSAYADIKSVMLGLEVLKTATGEVLDPMPMFDDGQHNDAEAGDGIYAAQVAAQESQTLVHYWVIAEDVDGRTTQFPYESDPAPTGGYFHYDNEIETNQTTYFMFMPSQSLRAIGRNPRLDLYYDCTVVIDDRREGKAEGPVVYPHIGARRRGRGSRNDARHQWKFQFNKNKLYDGNRVIDTMLNVPARQNMPFVICKFAGIEDLESDVIRLHLNGRFWQYYISFESPNSSWVAKHGYGNRTEAYKARSVETPGEAKNSDLYRNDLRTDLDFWGAWNKKLRALQPPIHIREMTNVMNDFQDPELHAWIDANMDFEQILTRYGIYILLNIDDFAGHNFYFFRPEDDKWKMLGYDFDSLHRGITLNITYADGRGGSPAWQRSKLFNRISDSPTLKRIHILNMRRILNTFWTQGQLHPIIDASVEPLDTRARGAGASHTKAAIAAQIRAIPRVVARQGLPTEEFVPKIDPPGGVVGGAVSVTMTTPEEWVAVYTTDGSDPRLSPTAMEYDGPIEVTAPVTVKAASRRGAAAAGNWTDLAVADFRSSDGAQVFLRGDINLNGAVNATDVVQLLLHLFRGMEISCRIAGDANNDDALNVSDAIFLTDFLFRRGGAPAAPFPQAGVDPDGDLPLGCSQGM